MTHETMTAAVLVRHGGPEALEIREDVPVPTPGPGEVRVTVSAAALNNTDIWTRQGAYGTAADPGALAGWRGRVAFPRIQGGDVAGRISAVGPGVDAARVGRRVLVDPALYDTEGDDAHPVGLLGSERDGGFADEVVVAVDRAHDVGSSPLDDAQLAALPIAHGTAMGMLERAGVRRGETAVVTGASGGVGLAAVQLAVARGTTVVAISEPAKADLIREAGATTVLDRHDPGLAEAVAAARPDVLVDVVGGTMLTTMLPGLVEGGRAVVAGAVAGPLVELDLRRLYLHNRTLIGSSMHTPAHFARLVEHARAGEVVPRVAASYPLARLAEAQARFGERTHVGKIVVVPAAGD